MFFERRSFGVILVAGAFSVGCGGGASNTVKTKEDAAKIASAIAAVQALVSLGGEAACPDGGSVKSETTIGGDIFKGELSSKVTTSFNGCVSQGVTLSGSVAQEVKTASSGSSTFSSGQVDTSLSTCLIDLRADSTSAALTGKYCGFDYSTF